jgi:O-antigen biosynthesis protein
MTEPAGRVRAPLSVVVPTRNRADRLAGCLARLQNSVAAQDEIVVVDSASDDDATAKVAEEHGARWVRVDVAGASRARNAGWRSATNELIAFIDDDVRVDDEWADAMSRALSEPGVAFVTGWIGVTGAEQQDPQPLMIDPNPRDLDRETRGAFGASANVGARREALARIGGFDERIGPATWFAAGEDAEFFDRLVLAGLTGRYSPDVRVDHDHERSRADRLRLHWSYGKGSGARIRLLLLSDRGRAAREARELMWRRGVVQGLTRIRQRWAIGAACSFLRVTGSLLALMRASVALRSRWPTAD